MITAFDCQHVTASTTECSVTATSTVDTVNFHDWLFVNVVLIFLMSFLVWGFLLNWMKK